MQLEALRSEECTPLVHAQVIVNLESELAAVPRPADRRRIRQMTKAIRRNPARRFPGLGAGSRRRADELGRSRPLRLVAVLLGRALAAESSDDQGSIVGPDSRFTYRRNSRPDGGGIGRDEFPTIPVVHVVEGLDLQLAIHGPQHLHLTSQVAAVRAVRATVRSERQWYCVADRAPVGCSGERMAVRALRLPAETLEAADFTRLAGDVAEPSREHRAADALAPGVRRRRRDFGGFDA